MEQRLKERSPLSYYPALDGLRSVAVILVVLFHLEVSWFKGGFIGVDVFFVISGYLITLLLLREFEGGVSLLSFYVRRFKRIIPALATTMLVSFAFAFALFIPTDLHRFSAAYLFSLIGLSNFSLWFESGYFDSSNLLKPDLHAWSLGVELQFYLLWPLLILFLIKRFGRWTVLGVVGLVALVSLLGNLWVLGQIPALASSLPEFVLEHRVSTAYYLMPFRIFEFAIGAGVALLGGAATKGVRSVAVADSLVVLGLFLVIFSGVYIDRTLPFPSVTALLPCVGAAMTIWAAGSSRIGAWVLGNPVAVKIGVLSYSIYLVHWPILVFYRYTTAESTAGHYAAYFALLGLLAYTLHRLVEVPMRRSKFFGAISPKRLAVTGTVLLAFALPTFAARMLESLGDGETLLSEFVKNTEAANSRITQRDPSCTFQDFSLFDPAKCTDPTMGKINVLVIGDSVAERIWSGLRALLPERFEMLQLTPSNCRPGLGWGEGYCRKSNDYIFSQLKSTHYDLVILGSLGPDHANLAKTLQYLKAVGQPTVEMGLPFVFNERLPDIVLKNTSRHAGLEEIRAVASEGLINNFTTAYHNLKQVALDNETPYYDFVHIYCTSVYALGSCDFIVDKGFLTKDNNHLTQTSAEKALRPLAGVILRATGGGEGPIDLAVLRAELEDYGRSRAPSVTATSVLSHYGPTRLLFATEPGWHAARNPTYPVHIDFAFEAVVTVGKISLLPQNSEPNRMPSRIRIEASDDGQDWWVVSRINDACESDVNHWAEFKLPERVRARNFRLVIEKNCGNPSLLTLSGVRFE